MSDRLEWRPDHVTNLHKPSWRKIPCSYPMNWAAPGCAGPMAVNPIQLQRFRRRVDYAVTSAPRWTARANGAPAHVLDTLDSLSRDHFKSPNDVSETLGGRN